MSDEIEQYFIDAATAQAIIHADKQPPEAKFKTFEELMAWLNNDAPTQTIG